MTYRLFLLAALLTGSAAFADLPAGAEFFLPPGLDGIMAVESDDVRFALLPNEGDFTVEAAQGDRPPASFDWPDSAPLNPDRLFLARSRACGTETADLIIRLVPPELADLQDYTYYRMVFAPDLTQILTHFYDPTVAAFNAVLPLQKVIGDAHQGEDTALVCDGSLPVVSEQSG